MRFSTGFVNPVWRALTGEQREFSVPGPGFLRVRPEVLPFAAVERAGMPVDGEAATAHGYVFFCDALPALRGEGFSAACFDVAQMVYRGGPVQAQARADEAELSLDNAGEMVELTDVAFPGFFRPETARLGRYIGIRQDGRLVATAGERFRFDGLFEVSAVCTRPGYTGRGLAAHLVSRLLHGEGGWPFLHVTATNARAMDLYRRLGFEHFNTIQVMKVERTEVG